MSRCKMCRPGNKLAVNLQMMKDRNSSAFSSFSFGPEEHGHEAEKRCTSGGVYIPWIVSHAR